MPSQIATADEGFYRVPVSTDNGFYHEFYFYRTRSGEFDLRYHWSYLDGAHPTLNDAIAAFRQAFDAHHNLSTRGVTLTIGAPVSVTTSEVEKLRPQWFLSGP